LQQKSKNNVYSETSRTSSGPSSKATVSSWHWHGHVLYCISLLKRDWNFGSQWSEIRFVNRSNGRVCYSYTAE